MNEKILLRDIFGVVSDNQTIVLNNEEGEYVAIYDGFNSIPTKYNDCGVQKIFTINGSAILYINCDTSEIIKNDIRAIADDCINELKTCMEDFDSMTVFNDLVEDCYERNNITHDSIKYAVMDLIKNWYI